jgi:uncharacterized protein
MKEIYTLNADCYVIPYEEKGPDAFIAYFPIQSLIFEINKDAAAILVSLKVKPYKTENPSIKQFLNHLRKLKVLNNKIEPHPYVPFKTEPAPTRTILLLSESCMLKCLYCYDDAQSRGEMMPLQIAKDAIDTIINNAIEQNIGDIIVGYHGGGEPTLNWPVLTGSYYYAKKRCKEENLKLTFSICSNGIMTTKKALWIIENIQEVAISLDGPPEIQNKQRPFQNGKGSFEKVATTIDLFNKHKKRYAIRLTATEFSEGKLSKIIEFLINRFHPSTICVEPLFVCGRCETSGCKPPLEDHFINEMINAYELGKEKRVTILYSGNRISLLLSRFCGAQGSNFFITPRGDVTSCLEISDRGDPRANFFIYGSYNPIKRQFKYDNEKYKRLAGNQVNNFESCRDCFAKWHCGGDCLAKTPDLEMVSSQRNSYRCKINKTLIRDSLIKIMNHQIEFSNSVLQ